MNRGITKENLLLIMPPALTHDKSIMALAAADAEALAVRLEEIDRVRIISNIDGLDEAVLDILARDFKVDWYDPDYSLEEKRRTLKDSWRVHKTLGTRAAVETAISAIYPETTVEEWFEYGGEPYHFRLRINLANDSGDITKQRRVFQRLNFYKSLRSHVDEVKYFLKPEKVWAYAGAAFMGSRREAAAYIPITVTPPGSRAEILAGGGLLGAYLHIRTTAEVGPMKAVGGSAAAGGRRCPERSIPENIHSDRHSWSGGTILRQGRGPYRVRSMRHVYAAYSGSRRPSIRASAAYYSGGRRERRSGRGVSKDHKGGSDQWHIGRKRR